MSVLILYFDTRNTWRANFWSREWVHDPAQLAEIVRVTFGPKVSPEEPRVGTCMNEIRRFYDEFHPLTEPATRLELADPKFLDGLAHLAKVILKSKFISPGFLFLLHTESGMCNLLHTLKARVTTTQIAREWKP